MRDGADEVTHESQALAPHHCPYHEVDWDYVGDTGRENGNSYIIGVIQGLWFRVGVLYIGIMEKKIEITKL